MTKHHAYAKIQYMTQKRAPRTDPAERLQQLGMVLPTVSKEFHGPVLFVPSPQVVADAMNMSRGPLNSGDTTFTDKAVMATGRPLLHDGIVLGPDPNVNPVDSILSVVEALPQDLRMQLVTRLALNMSTQLDHLVK
ncbi:MAG: hypothetical protein JWO47_162 [Candidatus Saccharibacteria bacterium]|nr:hypothetical protein [Candidatus Saccharibacteria bacterium]